MARSIARGAVFALGLLLALGANAQTAERCRSPGSEGSDPVRGAGAPTGVYADLVAAGERARDAGHLEGARVAFTAAAAHAVESGETEAEWAARVQLARTLRDQGRPARARDAIHAGAKRLAGRGLDAEIAIERAVAARWDGDLGAAAAALAGIGEPGPLAYRLAHERANLALAEGRFADAAEAYTHALSLASEPDAVRVRLNRARALARAGQFAAAREDLGVVAAASTGTGRAELAQWMHAGRTRVEIADREGAAAAYRRALLVAEGRGDSAARASALVALGGVYADAGETEQALALVRRALLVSRGAGETNTYRIHAALAALLEPEDRAAALAEYRAAVRALDRVDSGGSGRGAEEVRAILRSTVDLLLRQAATTEAVEVRRGLLREAQSLIERAQASELRDYFEDPCLASQRQASVESIPRTVVVYPIALADRTELIVSMPGDLVSLLVPIGREALRERVAEFRRLLTKRTTREYRRPAAALYDALVRPIRRAIGDRDVDTWVIVPSGPLRTIPLGALYDAESREFLIEQVPLAIAPGLTLIEPRAVEPGGLRVLAAGLTEAVQGFPSLGAVSGELDGLEERFGAERLQDAAFVEAALERALTSTSFGVVHIASHGEFHADLGRSFLLTYDGRIGMDRLADVVGVTKLRTRSLELLTLSACESAASDERAALGLAGVAVRAGARSALATLWSVNDRATSKLVDEFYRHFATPGVSRALALRRAQIGLIRSRVYRHPGYWSPFILINSWL